MTTTARAMTKSLYIDGDWLGSESKGTFAAVSPGTGTTIAELAKGTRTDAVRAIEAANRAFPAWMRSSAFERAAFLERVVGIIERRAEELAQALTLDQGKPLGESRGEVEELIAYFRMAAADATRIEGLMPPSVDARKRVLVYRVPLGVVGVISPWNWPYTMPAELIAPALAAGNTVVWNPASSTSYCGVKLAECIAEAGFPPGVFNLVTGPGAEVGDELAGNPGTQAIGFIGSYAAGSKVALRASLKELILELGGNGPLVILEDADLDRAVAATLTACFLNAGQSCTAGERILVHEAVHRAYVEKLAAAVGREIRLGDPLDERTTMGPLNNEPQARKMDEQVADAIARGARVVTGGKRHAGAPTPLYYEATILDGVTDEMLVAREETFGPVAPITPIRSADEAIAMVNASPYGLLSAVFTRDLATGIKFAESVRSGWVNVNEGTNYWESHLPFGGRAGSESGTGRVGGRHALERFTELKTVVVDLH